MATCTTTSMLTVGGVLCSLALGCVADTGHGSRAPDRSSLLSVADPEAPFGYVSAEFMSVAEVEAALPLLSERRVDVALAWPADESEEERAERFELVRRAADVGVSIRPWLLLPDADGYWPGSTNAQAFDSAARDLVEAWLEADLAPSMLLIDMEMPLERTQRFVELAQGKQLGELVNFLREGVDRDEYRAATATYKALVEHLHERGFKAEISTLSLVLDDYGDGDDGLRQALTIPIDGIAWDLVTFQVYRTLASTGLGTVPTSYYVRDYAQRARVRFGAKAGVILGLVDPGDLTEAAPVYESPEQAIRDVQVALATGISREFIGLYQLRGIVDRTPSEAWFQGAGPARWLPRPDRGTFLARASATTLDLAL